MPPGAAGGTATSWALWSRWAGGQRATWGGLAGSKGCLSYQTLLRREVWGWTIEAHAVPETPTQSNARLPPLPPPQAGLEVVSQSRWHFGTSYIIRARPARAAATAGTPNTTTAAAGSTKAA